MPLEPSRRTVPRRKHSSRRTESTTWYAPTSESVVQRHALHHLVTRSVPASGGQTGGAVQPSRGHRDRSCVLFPATRGGWCRLPMRALDFHWLECIERCVDKKSGAKAGSMLDLRANARGRKSERQTEQTDNGIIVRCVTGGPTTAARRGCCRPGAHIARGAPIPTCVSIDSSWLALKSLLTRDDDQSLLLLS